jgi:dTDP-4-amino-4,6-dideoxygalactose transaminase
LTFVLEVRQDFCLKSLFTKGVIPMLKDPTQLQQNGDLAVVAPRSAGPRIAVKQEAASVSMSAPDLTNAERQAVNRVLDTPTLSLGPQLEDFERAVASYIGTAHAVGVNSGTSGLHLSIVACGVEEADLVITTPFSFVASANCILYERAIPIFVDVDPATGNIDSQLVAEAVGALERGGPAAEPWLPPVLRGKHSSGGRGQVRAILPVHSFGQPADMDPILAVAHQYALAVIEDACEAIGAEYKGRRAGSLSDAAVFAFYPNKQMTTGEGGMIVTDKDAWAQLFRSLRNQGRDVFDGWLNHTRLGYNYRLDELSAALGRVQMGRIEELLAKRERVADWYNERLADIELLERPHIVPTTTRNSWFVYVVRIKPPASRNDVIRKLAEAGIPSRPYFTPIHLQPFYREKFGYQRGNFPVTEYLGDVSLALPFSGVMKESAVDVVHTALLSALPH